MPAVRCFDSDSHLWELQRSSSTVLDASFVDVQGRQAVTLFPVVQACELVARGETKVSGTNGIKLRCNCLSQQGFA
jgi:hypothetical protein